MKEKKVELEKLDLPFVDPDERVEFVKVDCPSCNSVVHAENIDLDSKIGKCTQCQALFSVEKELMHLRSTAKFREEVKRPEGVDIFYFNNEMEIETIQPLPTLQIVNISLSPFIVLFATALYFLKGIQNGMYFAIVASLFTAYALYDVIRRKDYKIYVNIDSETLNIQRRPSRLIKDKSFRRSEIEQVYVKQTTDGMALCLILNGEEGQKHKQILTRIRDVSQAKYMEQEIERYLGIQDKVVHGEL